VSDPVTYTAVLPIAEETVHFVSRLLAAERRRRGSRGQRRALGCYRQAVLALRWFVDDIRLPRLASDYDVVRSWRIGAITAAALVFLHHEHGRST
jgi:hypothetical protein